MAISKEKIIHSVQNYVPQGVAPFFADWVILKKIALRITPERKSKLGDYRPPYGNHGHRISINGSLNPYAFMITFLHELAHLVTWEKYKNRVLPHGKEWKIAFKEVMNPYLVSEIFPPDVRKALRGYMQNPAAATCRDERLLKSLKQYDENANETIFLESLPQGYIFEMKDGRIFKKEHKLRKYILCTELISNRQFRVPALAEIKPIEPDKERLTEAHNPDWVMLQSLPKGAVFTTKNGLKLEKQQLLRKNYLCKEVGTDRVFKAPAALMVQAVTNNN